MGSVLVTIWAAITPFTTARWHGTWLEAESSEARRKEKENAGAEVRLAKICAAEGKPVEIFFYCKINIGSRTRK